MKTYRQIVDRINAVNHEIAAAEFDGHDGRVLWLLAIKARLHAGLIFRNRASA